MKVRHGFVTNSSSSSFIIAFKKKEDMDNLNISAEALAILNNEDPDISKEISKEEALQIYRNHFEKQVDKASICLELSDMLGISYSDAYHNFLQLKNTEEYQKAHDKVFNKWFAEYVNEFEENAQDKEFFLLVWAADEYASYREISELKETIGQINHM